MDDFNFDSLDLGSRTWSPPSYVAIAPPIVTRDKGQAQSRCDRCIHEGPETQFLVWCLLETTFPQIQIILSCPSECFT